VSDLLAAEGFTVVGVAGSSSEALESVQREHPDLVLLDVRLPGTDGIAVSYRLSRLATPPDVVLVSSRAASSYGSRLRSAPVRGFLRKDQVDGRALRALLGSGPG
jgi:DNA-binding NarL/FixJ family response regulator